MSRNAGEEIMKRALATPLAPGCAWCGEVDARTGSKLCSQCAVCAGCGKVQEVGSGLVLKSVGRKLYCEGPCLDDAQARYDAEKAQRDARALVRAAGIYPKHETVTVDLLNGNQPAVATSYLAYPFGNIILSGGSGCGKTWTAVAVLRRLLERSDCTGRFLHVPWLFASLRDWMADDTSKFRLTKFVDELLAYDYVVLDDLGAHRATDWAVETLLLIMSRWELLGKKGGMIVTTNLDLDTIASVMDDRIASRLAEDCKYIRMEGPDRRLQKRRGS